MVGYLNIWFQKKKSSVKLIIVSKLFNKTVNSSVSKMHDALNEGTKYIHFDGPASHLYFEV